MPIDESPDPFEGLEPKPESVVYRPRPSGKGRRIILLALACVLVLIVVVLNLEVCGVAVWPRHPDAWERITYKEFPEKHGSQDVFYNGRVTRADAAKLGDFLHREGTFQEPRPISVFLTRRGDAFVVSFFLLQDISIDPLVVAYYCGLRERISREAFGGAVVEIDLCEQRVKSGLTPQLSVLRTIDARTSVPDRA